MTNVRSVSKERDEAERRGDDTHWWKAYQRHSKATSGTGLQSTHLANLIDSPLPLKRAPFRPTETEIQRAANRALGSLPAPSIPVVLPGK